MNSSMGLARLAGSFAEHLEKRSHETAEALVALGFDELVLHSGTPFRYFGDDMDAPHHPNPHFASWVPLAGPHHLLRFRPGEKPLLVRVAPADYWYEQESLGDPFWVPFFEYREVPDEESAWRALDSGPQSAYLGDSPQRAAASGIPLQACNPSSLLARMDWARSYKSDYEVICIEEATRSAARGHRAARTRFMEGGDELAVHQAFVGAARCTDAEQPYESIVAFDDKGSILHYLGKRREVEGRVLLIDSGTTFLGYASDITRTWARPDCEPLFAELLAGMEDLQQDLCAAVCPGLPYPELHLRAHVLVGELLHRLGILRVSGEDALALGLTAPFLPHGLGHFLGVQVHDVAGRQESPEGGVVEPPRGHPFLRTTRCIEEGQVFTIEPGCYFIPMLLQPVRESALGREVDWTMVERLLPHGGIRIEDDLLVTAEGARNLTRPFLP